MIGFSLDNCEIAAIMRTNGECVLSMKIPNRWWMKETMKKRNLYLICACIGLMLLTACTSGGETSADASAANGGGSMLVMMIVLIAVFYLFMIRPENKRKKEAQAMRDAIKVGDNITTIGGIIGTICSVKENTIVIETGADRVRIEFTKWAVSTKNSSAAAAEQK